MKESFGLEWGAEQGASKSTERSVEVKHNVPIVPREVIGCRKFDLDYPAKCPHYQHNTRCRCSKLRGSCTLYITFFFIQIYSYILRINLGW